MAVQNEAGRVSAALELEIVALGKGAEEIDKDSYRAEDEAAAQCAARGLGGSGILGSRILAIHRERAKRIVDKRIESEDR